MKIAGTNTKDECVDPPAKRVKSAKKRLLVVGDMQKDYDKKANIELYGSVQSPYANDIAPFVPAINRIRNGAKWDKIVFTLDWLSAEQLTGRTAFCLEDTSGAELLDGLEVDYSNDIFFKKNNDDSFCLEGGLAEAKTGCSRLGDVLSNLGFHPADTSLYFVGQRFERCILKTVMHAADLGYESILVDEATYTKDQDPDPAWSLSDKGEAAPAQAADVYLARKGAGRRLAERYLLEANVKIIKNI